MNPEEPRLAPSLLFHSFLIVAGAYVVHLVLLFGIAYLVFPDSVALLGADPEEYQRIMENEPERIFPRGMFWLLLIAGGIVCSVLGYVVTMLAPLSKFSHALFFAAVLFAAYLQLAIGAEADLRPKLILLMVVTSVAALLGANRYLQTVPTEPTEN
jgi:hypothetical protein